MLMVAAHGWDLAGAAAAGYRTAFTAQGQAWWIQVPRTLWKPG